MRPDDSTPARADPQHRVQIYDDDAFLVESVVRFAGAALGAGDAVVLIATEHHLAAVEEGLEAQALSVATARAQGRYVALEAARTLAELLQDGRPDAERFEALIGAPIRAAAARPGAQVHAFGEMVSLLWGQGRPEAAVRLEELWSELARTLPLSVLCAYPKAALEGGAADADAARAVRDLHSDVLSSESPTALASPEERLHAVGRLHRVARATELDKSRRVNEQLLRLAAIVESSDDAIVGKTLDGIVTSWNPAAERIFGFSAAEMIGTPISRIFPPERQSDALTILGKIRRGERVNHFETERVRKDGRRIDVSLTVSPIRDASGRIIGASKIARDVTERKRLEAEREQLLALAQRACAEAEAASRSKDEFLATLSHELRNPLAAVRNAIGAARLGEGDSERALGIAARQTEQLSRLIDDLLDVSRITHGRVRLNRKRIALRDVLEGAVETTRHLVEERAQKLQVSLPADSVRVDGDPLRLEQIVVNLIGNAVKHTERGGSLAVSGGLEGDEAVIRVRDDGEGIAPELLPRIFDLFVQGHPPGARASGGLGIGLAIVRSLASLHGGRVEAHSEGLGKGAEFVVRLPAAEVSQPAAVQPAAYGAGRGESGVRVLLVEDNLDAAESMMMLLEVFGHSARVAPDGAQALEQACADPPGLMLVDIGLPGIDGYEVARRVRATPELRDVALIALTGFGRDQDRHLALAAGFDHHLTKPVDPEALRKVLARVASGERRFS
jgi:PAS domain S-box-containing protein